MRVRIIKLLPLLLFALLVLFFWRGLSLDPHKLPSTMIEKPLPDFSLPELSHRDRLFTPKDLNHEISLLNVWASWCDACAQEQVFLMQLATEGVPIFGLNYKDNPNDAKQWLSEWGNPYKLIGEDKDGRAAIDLGVYGTPETFLIDKKGRIRYRHTGPMTPLVWEQAFIPRWKELEETE
ncbi:DsbE family thiol:disulfide interchange protein [Legionella impletisoli]|uniref:Cytochrome c biogenesis protein n=1 Tax=Legionella impletisoli TaxID=343510 RepID=A0A917JRG6_9GAMM|nr:DsbE family thiol:disulfide interchange protein [Legionella impletisoli]GGI78722.1 cytochrome c biogenesis protein [Legionella impletisoli]